jgi:acetyl esterase
MSRSPPRWRGATPARRPGGALALFYGVFGADLGTASYLAFGDGRFGLSRAQMEHYWRSFLGAEPAPGGPADLVSVSLGGLPPVHLAAAGLDVLRDDTLRLAAALRAAGVPHSLRMWGGVVHSFLLYSAQLPQARDAIADAARFLVARLRDTPRKAPSGGTT